MDGYVGITRYLYRNTGSYGSPTWDLIGNARNVQLDDSWGEANVTRRALAISQVEPTSRNLAVSWEMIEDTADSDFTTLRTAYAAKTLVEFAISDGPIATSGSIYLRMETKLFQWNHAEPIDGEVVDSIVAKPCYSANAPSRVTVS